MHLFEIDIMSHNISFTTFYLLHKVEWYYSRSRGLFLFMDLSIVFLSLIALTARYVLRVNISRHKRGQPLL